MLLQEKFAKCELRCQIVANRSKGGQLKILVSSNSKEKTPLALALHAELDVICPHLGTTMAFCGVLVVVTGVGAVGDEC